MRNLLGGIVVLGLFGFAVLISSEPKSRVAATIRDTNVQQGGRILLFSKGDPAIPADARVLLLSAQQETTFDGVKALLRGGDLLVIDDSAFADVPSGFLREQIKAGRPIIGLNISAADLSARSGFLDLSGAVEPHWKQDTTFPSRPNQPFFSFLFLAQAGGTWQRAVAQPYFSDGLFRSYLHQARLAAQGLTFVPGDNGGKVIPLRDLSSPHVQ